MLVSHPFYSLFMASGGPAIPLRILLRTDKMYKRLPKIAAITAIRAGKCFIPTPGISDSGILSAATTIKVQINERSCISFRHRPSENPLVGFSFFRVKSVANMMPE